MRTERPDCRLQFAQLLEQHETAILAYIRRLVPARSDAEDVYQDVSVVLWEKQAEFRPDASFRAWAYGIARYKALAWIRDNRRKRPLLDCDLLEVIASEAEEDDSLFERQRDAFEKCLGKLPIEHQKLLRQAYQKNCDMAALSRASGRSKTGFYQWLYRMRRTLLECSKNELAREGS